MFMSNELSVFNGLSYEEAAKELGANVGNTLLPSLKINKLGEDDQGNTIPVGTFVVSQNSTSVYSKTAILRVFYNTFRYMKYDEGENKYVNKSLIIKNFREEAHDELGGLKCGKISKDGFDLLNDSQKAEQKSIKCYRLALGTVTFPDGGVENLPVVWSTSGLNFNTLNDSLRKMDRVKHLYPNHPISLKLRREKTGSNVYYVAEADVDLKTHLPLTAADQETFELFKSFMKTENDYVFAKWRKAKKMTPRDGDNLADLLGFDDEVIEGSDSLDDEIPF